MTENRRAGRRARVVQIGFACVFALIVARIGYVQNADAALNNHLKKYGIEWLAQRTIPPMRGTIYDANGNRLAFDMPAYDLDIDVRAIQKSGTAVMTTLAQRLAPVIGVSPARVLSELSLSGFSWLRWSPYLVDTTLPQEKRILAIFNNLGLANDISPYQTFKRVYPGGTFASHVLGFVTQQDVKTPQGITETEIGESGVEYAYNKYLTGRPGMQEYTQDSMGNPIPFQPVVTRPVRNGDSVYLTINAVLEHYAEEAISTMAKKYHLRHAAVILADPYTGAILAMAAYPNYNPNAYWKYPASTLDTNWAISDPFEPGSTFKVVTMTGALATHAISLNQTYMSGVDYVNGVPIHDWNWWGWGRITYTKALLLSSNTGFIHIGQAEGPYTLARYIRKFGMNRPTGIDLPGEGNSILFNPHHENAVDFATSTFGQGLAVTPIQQVQMIGAVANGGLAVTPYVVQKIVAPDGKVVYQHKTHVVDRVASPAIMRTMQRLLEESVSIGIAGTAGVPGYQVAGKTGTAQIPKPGGGYYQNAYNMSFVGFVPAYHPVFDLYVTVEDMHTTQLSDAVAGPAASWIMGKSLAYLRVPAQGQSVSAIQTAAHMQYVTIPNLVGRPVTSAASALQRLGLAVTLVDQTGQVTRQWPAAGVREAVGEQVTLATGASTAQSGYVRVPDLHGLPLIEAVSVCSLLGLQLSPAGDGYAVSQSIAPGRTVPIGFVLAAHFAARP